MSGTLNKVMLIGHLGDEVKIHRFEDGGCVGRFPLATNETYMNKQTNERVSNTSNLLCHYRRRRSFYEPITNKL